ncbi:MAG: PD40 domain-containing protein [Acidobacteria bacterium]|nr:PD40 domain-containing protein [Acidobacteriota bacterium]
MSKTIPNDKRLMKFEINPPENVSFDVFSLSPDGRWLAFIGTRGSKTNLWVRALDSSNVRELPQTEGARYPFWSPDSRGLAFFAGNKLKKLDISGGPAEILCDVVNPTGGAWGTDGNIIFSFINAGLRQIPAVGGEVKRLTTLDNWRQERIGIIPHSCRTAPFPLYQRQCEQRVQEYTLPGSTAWSTGNCYPRTHRHIMPGPVTFSSVVAQL